MFPASTDPDNTGGVDLPLGVDTSIRLKLVLGTLCVGLDPEMIKTRQNKQHVEY